ncbi:hypothetical protein lerEdw1_017890 [Lerista edwardsae]|nr:hypothetical protein lerEdw1_017890 [Lerista edwardsae]
MYILKWLFCFYLCYCINNLLTHSLVFVLIQTSSLSSVVDEEFSFKYSPGKLRGNQYKTMMTKEELEEEQRVQREQLTAIFTLMKEKTETFGDMSETDIKEQLKLYDM